MTSITIIVPAYNAEKTLERAVLSLINQTLPGVLVVIINDGSTDGTAVIANQLAGRHASVTVVHQSNAGCYLARLSGLRQVKTEYFGFLDADDYVEPEKFERMLSFAEKYNLDIVKCDLKDKGARTPEENELFLTREEVLAKVVLPNLIEGRGSALVWDKIYRNKYDFGLFEQNNYTTFEDLVYNLQFFLKAERVGYLHEPLHIYEVTAESSTRNYGEKNIAGLVATIRSREKLIPLFGLGNSTDANAVWIAKNVKNALMVIAAAPRLSFSRRRQLTRNLLMCDEVRAVLSRRDHEHVPFVGFLRLIARDPLGGVLAALCLAKRIQVILKGFA